MYFSLKHSEGHAVRRWCSGIMQDSHSCDPGSIPGRRKIFEQTQLRCLYQKVYLPDGESNPGLLRDRQGSLPLDYRGLVGRERKL